MMTCTCADLVHEQDAGAADEDLAGGHALLLAAADAPHHRIADHRVRAALQAQDLDDVFHPGAGAVASATENMLPFSYGSHTHRRNHQHRTACKCHAFATRSHSQALNPPLKFAPS